MLRKSRLRQKWLSFKKKRVIICLEDISEGKFFGSMVFSRLLMPA